MTGAELRYWIMMQPRPASLRCTCADGVRMVPCTSQTFTKIAASVSALAPELVEALDSTGTIIRAVRPDQEEDGAPVVPLVPPPVAVPITPETEETKRFVLVANLLSDAHRFSTGLAFDKLVALMDVHARRAEALERALATKERLLEDAKAATAEAEADATQAELEAQHAGPLGTLGPMLEGIAHKFAPNAAPNGKA